MAFLIATGFSGIGVGEYTLRGLPGVEVVHACEYRPDIADWYEINHGVKPFVGREQDDNPLLWPVRPDLLAVSPVCKFSSKAREGKPLSQAEITEMWSQAHSICNKIKVLRPEFFELENVREYATKKESKPAFDLIVQTLLDCGYWLNFDVQHSWADNSLSYPKLPIENAANFGIAQTRERLIVRACNSGPVPPMRKKLRKSEWRGWYDAITNELPNLKEDAFAPWQLPRLEKYLDKHFGAVGDGLLIPSQNAGNEGNTVRASNSPATTAMPGTMPRAWVVGGGNTNLAEADTGNGVRSDELPYYTVTGSGSRVPKALLVGVQNKGDDGQTEVSVKQDDDPAYTVTPGMHKQVIRALLIDDQNGGATIDGERGLTVRKANEPSYTILASANHRVARALIEQGRVVRLNVQCLAEFQNCYGIQLPENNTGLACEMVGNGNPFLRDVVESFLNVKVNQAAA